MRLQHPMYPGRKEGCLVSSTFSPRPRHPVPRPRRPRSTEKSNILTPAATLHNNDHTSCQRPNCPNVTAPHSPLCRRSANGVCPWPIVLTVSRRLLFQHRSHRHFSVTPHKLHKHSPRSVTPLRLLFILADCCLIGLIAYSRHAGSPGAGGEAAAVPAHRHSHGRSKPNEE